MKIEKFFSYCKLYMHIFHKYFTHLCYLFKTWQDIRNITKTKAAAIKRHLGGTGSGPSCSVELNAIQIETLPLLSKASISGHSDSVESIVQFDFDGSTKDVITGK